MGFFSSAVKHVKSKVRSNSNKLTQASTVRCTPDASLKAKHPLVHKARKVFVKMFKPKHSATKVSAVDRGSEGLARPSPPSQPFLQRTSPDLGAGTVTWPSPSPLKLSVPVVPGARDYTTHDARLPPRGALQKPRARSNTPTGANKALLGELMRREEGVGLVFLSMFVVGVDITAQLTSRALRDMVSTNSTSSRESSSSSTTTTTTVERDSPVATTTTSSSNGTSAPPRSRSLLARGIAAMLLFVQEQGPLTQQAISEWPDMLSNALEARAQEDRATAQRLWSNLQEWTLDVEQAFKDATAGHIREVEAAREYLNTGVMPDVERSWPSEADFVVPVAVQEPVLEQPPTSVAESPRGFGARIKQAAAMLATPLRGASSQDTTTPTAATPTPTPTKAAAAAPFASQPPASAEEGNKIVSNIMGTVMQNRRDRVRDAVAAAAEGTTPDNSNALNKALADAERSAAKLDPLLGTASPSHPTPPSAAFTSDTTTKRAEGPPSTAPRRAVTPMPPAVAAAVKAGAGGGGGGGGGGSGGTQRETPRGGVAVQDAKSSEDAQGNWVLKGAATLGAFVLPWIIITKASESNGGAGSGGIGGNGGGGGAGGRGGGGRGKGDGGSGGGNGKGGNPLLRLLVLASCAVVGYMAREQLGRVHHTAVHFATEVVALTCAMWAMLDAAESDDDDDDVEHQMESIALAL